MSHACTLATVDAGLQLLEQNAYRRPRGTTRGDLAAGYLVALDDLPHDLVEQAFKSFIRMGGRRWPKADVIRTVAERIRREADAVATGQAKDSYHAWEARGWRDVHTEQLSPCPICGAMPQQEGLRVRVHHVHRRHHDARVPALV